MVARLARVACGAGKDGRRSVAGWCRAAAKHRRGAPDVKCPMHQAQPLLCTNKTKGSYNCMSGTGGCLLPWDALVLQRSSQCPLPLPVRAPSALLTCARASTAIMTSLMIHRHHTCCEAHAVQLEAFRLLAVAPFVLEGGIVRQHLILRQ